jgi:predicted enzyme related to lactoylglutathione lyase
MAATQLNSKLILCNVPTVKSEAALSFYNTLFGSDDFARAPNNQVESYFRPISADGINLTVTQRYDDREAITPYFAVESLEKAIEALQGAGGELIVKPMQVEMTAGREQGAVGRMAQMLDPDRNPVGLMELDESVHEVFQWGRYQKPLNAEQVKGIEQLSAESKERGKKSAD